MKARRWPGCRTPTLSVSTTWGRTATASSSPWSWSKARRSARGSRLDTRGARSWPCSSRRLAASPPRTPRASSTVTSSRTTRWSARTGESGSSISGSPGPRRPRRPRASICPISGRSPANRDRRGPARCEARWWVRLAMRPRSSSRESWWMRAPTSLRSARASGRRCSESPPSTGTTCSICSETSGRPGFACPPPAGSPDGFARCSAAGCRRARRGGIPRWMRSSMPSSATLPWPAGGGRLLRRCSPSPRSCPSWVCAASRSRVRRHARAPHRCSSAPGTTRAGRS